MSWLSSVWFWITSGFVLGILSSAHCFAMCGPIALWLGARIRPDENFHGRLSLTFEAGFGKALTYGFLGLASGAAGSVVATGFRAASFEKWIPVMWAVFLFTGGLMTAGSFLGAAHLRIKKIEKVFLRIFQSTALPGKRESVLLTGMFWGLLPCPMVLVPVIASAVAGGQSGMEGALRGFFMMFAFGIGTMPALSPAGLTGAQTAARFGRLARPVIGSMMMIAAGVWLAQYFLPGTGAHVHPH